MCPAAGGCVWWTLWVCSSSLPGHSSLNHTATKCRTLFKLTSTSQSVWALNTVYETTVAAEGQTGWYGLTIQLLDWSMEEKTQTHTVGPCLTASRCWPVNSTDLLGTIKLSHREKKNPVEETSDRPQHVCRPSVTFHPAVLHYESQETKPTLGCYIKHELAHLPINKCGWKRLAVPDGERWCTHSSVTLCLCVATLTLPELWRFSLQEAPMFYWNSLFVYTRLISLSTSSPSRRPLKQSASTQTHSRELLK